jgi:E3 ubiquitin-protein ligase TRIP12
MRDAGEKEGDAADAAEREDDESANAAGSMPPAPPAQEDQNALSRQDDPFAAGGFLARFGGHAGLSSSLRALSGLVSGTHARLRNILEQLRDKEDSSIQHIALQELSELLLVSTEDNLAGHFAPDQFVKELVTLMQPNELTGEENPEIMLLACRCIANLMEALPAATSSVVYGGAVPVLCQKLLEIHFIDLAEQALSTLEKISVDFPSSIVREGGLTACLAYLDFFAISTQRTAVTTAANCCRNIPEDSFATVRDVMPILLTTLSSNDQRVVEQASLCVSRIVDSFKYREGKLEELVSPELLRAVLRLLLPGTTNMIGPGIHTQFLRVLSSTARASSRLSTELLKMNVVDTLYQILTGVSAPTGTQHMATRIDKNIIMQAIIRTPREQIFETLNVICEMLPAVSQDRLTFLDDLQDAGYTGPGSKSLSTRSKETEVDERLTLLRANADEVRRFAVVLFPTLMYAYTSTVNLSVRQKVLTAQLKMLSNFDTGVLEEALSGVSYASHLASILSQQESSSLVTFGLQAAELLLTRLGHVYQPQFYREGVMAEIERLSERALQPKPSADEDISTSESVPKQSTGDKKADDGQVPGQASEALSAKADQEHDEAGDADISEANEENHEDDENDDNVDDDDDEGDNEDDDDDEDHEQEYDNPDGLDRHSSSLARHMMDAQDIITARARRFVEIHGDSSTETMRAQAAEVLNHINTLASDLRSCYSSAQNDGGIALFRALAKYFNNDALRSVTSYELKTSGIVEVLLEIFNSPEEQIAKSARAAFLEVFMAPPDASPNSPDDPAVSATALGTLLHKLQEVLSRSEHFEIITVHQNPFDTSRVSAASMLAKQLRLKLVADDASGVPKHYRNIMVSIHAIATFKALDDYLRPRISLAERPQGSRSRQGITEAMAAYAAAMTGHGNTGSPLFPSQPPALGSTLSTHGTPSQPPKNKPSRTGQRSPQTTGEQAQDGKTPLRRSGRTRTTAASATDSAARDEESSQATSSQQELQQPPDCVDETHVPDDDDDDDDIEAELDAIADDLEDEMMDEDASEPSAVDFEVAKSGKVVAKTEDGAAVATPTQDPTPSLAGARERLAALSRYAASREMLSTPSSSRAMSYASALQQPPTDWHLEFSVNGQPISSETTIYRACHFNSVPTNDMPARDPSGRSVWSAVHTISFKKVPGPATAEGEASTSQTITENTSAVAPSDPPALDAHPVTSEILKLMKILHEFNSNFEDIIAESKHSIRLQAVSSSEFINTKLSAKLNRQLEEPLIVASQCLPPWSEDLARLYPFLFPFETRHLFLQCTSFGYSRLMSRWQSSQSENDNRHGRHRDERPFLGRAQRQKVRISRSRILESAIKVMELYGSSSSILEVEYFEEVGTGLGPTLEFYSTVSKEFSKKKTKLWRENESQSAGDYAFGKRGLFPAPMSEDMASKENGQRVLHLFRMLGKFMARSMLDSRIIDVSLNPTFFRIGDGQATVSPSMGAVAAVDQDLAKSLRMLRKYVDAKQRIDHDTSLSATQKAARIEEIRINDMRVSDLGLDFTLPGYPHIELQPKGSEIDVTIENLSLYIKKVIDFTLYEGVQRQIDAFRAGFSLVFPYTALKAFTPDELVMLSGRVNEDWSLETLMDSVKADHGFNLDSKSVRNLLQYMAELSPQSKRDFLQFITGSPKLPIGGMYQTDYDLHLLAY